MMYKTIPHCIMMTLQGRIQGGSGDLLFQSVDYYAIAIKICTCEAKRTNSAVELPIGHCASMLQSIQDVGKCS